jgi:hypothetical protein
MKISITFIKMQLKPLLIEWNKLKIYYKELKIKVEESDQSDKYKGKITSINRKYYTKTPLKDRHYGS